MSQQEERKQKVTGWYPVSAEEEETRKKAQKGLKIITKPKVAQSCGLCWESSMP